MNDWIRRLKGVNNAAIKRVDATTARVDCWPVRMTKALCNTTMPPKPFSIAVYRGSSFISRGAKALCGSSANQ
jgi:hypothetical protein